MDSAHSKSRATYSRPRRVSLLTSLVIAAFSFSGGCDSIFPPPAPDRAQTEAFLYATNLEEKTISSFALIPDTDSVVPHPHFPISLASGFPYALATSPSGDFLYTSVTNTGIRAFRVDRATGGLSEIPGSPFPIGGTPHIAPSGKFMIAMGGAAIQAVRIVEDTGALSIVGSPVPLPPFRQPALSLAFSEDSSIVFVTRVSSLSIFRLNPTTGELTATSTESFPNASPAALAVSGDFLLTSLPNQRAISVSSIDGDTASLTPVAGSPFAMGGYVLQMAVHPNRRFVYGLDLPICCTPADPNGLSAFSVDQITGSVAVIPGSPYARPSEQCGGTIVQPWGRLLAIDASGEFLFTVDGCSSIRAYRIDGTTGALTPLAVSPFHSGTRPVSVAVISRNP